MIDDPAYKRFLELNWRRKLTLEEEAEMRAWLQAHPEVQAEWELDAGLNEALSALPQVAVASNFNARVLESIKRENQVQSRGNLKERIAWFHGLIPKLAVAAVVITAGLISYEQIHAAKIRERERQAEVVKSFLTVSKLKLPEPEILEDFETIRQGAGFGADEKLLTLLQ